MYCSLYWNYIAPSFKY